MSHSKNDIQIKSAETKKSEQYINNIHHWLRYHYGSANKCENKECSSISKNYTWALIHGKEYEKNRDNFRMLCAKCHLKYDYNGGLHEAQREAMKKTSVVYSKINGRIAGKIYGKIYGYINGSIVGRKTSKLTAQQIREIREKCLSGKTHIFLAKRYNVCRQTIDKIIIGQRYKWVE